MPSSLLPLLDVATRHTIKVAGMSAKGTASAMAITVDDIAVTTVKPSSEGIPQHLEHRFVLSSAALSGKNKLWMYPLLLGTVALVPGLLHPLLTIGGLYLAYEGYEEAHELYHHWKHRKDHADGSHDHAPVKDTEGYEIPEPIVETGEVQEARLRQIVKEAGVLDLILSAEIGIMALKGMGASAAFAAAAATYAKTGDLTAYLAPLGTHGPAIMGVAALVTAGVYVPVWALLRADNWAERLSNMKSKAANMIGAGLVPATHAFMRALPYIGTGAMLAVGGHIMLENFHSVAEAVKHFAHSWGPAGLIPEYTVSIAIGLVSGKIVEKLIVPVITPVWGALKNACAKLKPAKAADETSSIAVKTVPVTDTAGTDASADNSAK
jgi:predicted DNA repair protein MutK